MRRWLKSFAALTSLLLLVAATELWVIYWRVDYRVVKIGEKSYKLDVGPQLVEGTYYFPLRFIAEEMGHKIGWMPTLKTALVRGQGRSLEIAAGKLEYKTLGKSVKLRHAAYIKWERMLIPQELLTDEFGIQIKSENGKEIFMDINPALLQPRAADFTLPTQDGSALNFNEVLGNPSTKCVLVNFWSTRCLPCKREIPELVKLYNKYKDKGLVVLGVCTDSDGLETEREDLIEELGITYPILLDPLAETYYKWGGLNVPNMSLVNKDGNIVFQHDGYSPDTPAKAESAIKKELGLP